MQSVQPLPARGRSAQPASALQRLEHLAQTLILDREAVTKLRSCEHHAAGQIVQHSLLETAWLSVLVLRYGLQVRRVRIGRDERKWIGGDAGAARCSVESTRCSLPRRR